MVRDNEPNQIKNGDQITISPVKQNNEFHPLSYDDLNCLDNGSKSNSILTTMVSSFDVPSPANSGQNWLEASN